MIKKIILSAIGRLGYTVQKKQSQAQLSPSTMPQALDRLKGIGLNPNLVIDVGAAKGNWTKLAKFYFPQANYVLVEPLQEQTDQIGDRIVSARDKILNVVIGNETKVVPFTISEDLDGSGLYGGTGKTRDIQMIKLAQVIEGENVLVKLDTHGYELEIFEGIEDGWMHVTALIIEVYGFYVSPTGKLFHEIASFLEQKGFRLFDIVDITRRKGDNAFWQADAVFLKSSHRLFNNNKYQ